MVELDQEDADAWYYIGFIYNQTNNYEQAVIALTKVIGMEADAGVVLQCVRVSIGVTK